MCRWSESVDAMGDAADRLADACEAQLRGLGPVDPAAPVRSGISRALQRAIREVTVTPADMALQLRKLDK